MAGGGGKGKRGSGEREWVSQLGEIKVSLTFSTPTTPAESPPVSSPSLLPPPPPRRWISELGFPRLLSEEAIMMFWNTKAFHAQTSAWFGVKERAGLPAKLFLALPLTLISPPPALLSTASPTPSEDLTVQAAAGAPSSLPQLLRHSSPPPPFPHYRIHTHPPTLRCDPSCQYCSVFDPRGRRVRVCGGWSCSPQTTAAHWSGVNPKHWSWNCPICWILQLCPEVTVD